jgi:hypothetical protein
MVTMDMFPKGFYILGFDLKLDREAEEAHISYHRQGRRL